MWQTAAPPAVVKAPPTRPKDATAEKKTSPPEPEKKEEKAIPATTTTASSSVVGKISEQNEDEDEDGVPPPPPAGPPSKQATPSRPKKAGGDEDDQAIEMAELKRKLENAEAKLVRSAFKLSMATNQLLSVAHFLIVCCLLFVVQAEGGNPSSALLREAVLEEQLERAHATIVTLKHDKNALKLSIKELQIRLTNAQVLKKNGGDEIKAQTEAGVLEAMKRGEREKDLERQLIKAKKDKDKALKLLIQLIGKV